MRASRCPECDESVQPDDINLKEGVALCPACGSVSRLSELNCSGRSVSELLARPPKGCSVVMDSGSFSATVALRSLGGFIGPALFALFWNSLVSLFVLVAIAGLYSNLVGPVPSWFPAPGMNDGKPHMNERPMELGMTLFLCVFLIPFVTIGIGMVITALMYLIGQVRVVIDAYDSYVTTGFWVLQWKKRFDPGQVHSIVFGKKRWQADGEGNRHLEIRGNRTVKFGVLMEDDQQEWLRAVLRHRLTPRA